MKVPLNSQENLLSEKYWVKKWSNNSPTTFNLNGIDIFGSVLTWHSVEYKCVWMCEIIITCKTVFKRNKNVLKMFFYRRRQSLAAVEILFATSIDQSGPDEWPAMEGKQRKAEEKFMWKTHRIREKSFKIYFVDSRKRKMEQKRKRNSIK